MRRAAHIDQNQPAVMQYLRKLGMSVQPLHAVGQGVPDLLVGFRGQNFLVEIKNPDQFPSKQVLTKQQIEWHAKWAGQVIVATSAEEAGAIIARTTINGNY